MSMSTRWPKDSFDFYTVLFGSREIGECYVDFALSDHDLFANGFGDFSPLVQRQGRPTLVKFLSFVQHIFG